MESARNWWERQLKMKGVLITTSLIFSLSFNGTVMAEVKGQPKATNPPQVQFGDIEVNENLYIGERHDEEGHKDYVVTESTTGSKAELLNKDVPQSVVTVPQKVLEDQGISTMTDALENVSGVTPYYPSFTGNNDDYYYIRGFYKSDTLKDGLATEDAGGNTWMGDVERVEVLKGPAGLLYGAYGGDIGGVINVITKKPLRKPRYSIMGIFDTEGTRSVIIDISQPLNKNKTWLLRAIGEYGDYMSFADNNTKKKRPQALILQGLITPHDSITIQYEHLWQETHPYRATPAYALVGNGNNAYLWPYRIPGYPTQLNYYDPRTNYTYETHAARLVYEHEFNSNWNLKFNTRYANTVDESLVISASPTYNPTTNITTFRQSRNNYNFRENVLDSELMTNGKFSLFGVKNNMIAGARGTDYWYMGTWYNTRFGNYTFTDPAYPNWWQPQGEHRSNTWRDYEQYQYNLYLNDVAYLTDKLKLTAGLTYIHYERHQSSDGGYHYDSQENGIPWRIGLLYEAWPGIVPYFSYSTTFRPQWQNVTDDGVTQDFKPLTGYQYEFGVKVDMPKWATVTLSFYELTLQNTLSPDPDPVRADLGYEVEAGSQRSDGIELDVALKLAPGWDGIIAYAYTDTCILESQSFVSGSKVDNVPKHSLRLWSVYEFQPGSFLPGFGFGLGMKAVTDREMTLIRKARPQISGTMAGYAIFDGVLFYKLKGTKLGIFKDSKFSVNFTNILDKFYWESGSYSSLYRGEPFKATFRWEQNF